MVDICIHDTYLRARVLGLAAVWAEYELVYKIPYRRARAWPSGCSAFRPSASREQRYLAYKVRARVVYKIPYRRAPRLAYRVRRASKGILHTRARASKCILHSHTIIDVL